MIRLCCLGQWIEDQHITPADAALLSQNMNWRIELFNACRNVCPLDWRNVVHAQKLAGIKNSEIQKHYNYEFTQTFFHRVNKSEVSMDVTWLNWDKGNKYIMEWYVGAAVRFWNTVLRPLQFPYYVPDFEANLHYKAYMIKEHKEICWYFPDDVARRLEMVCSLPLSKGNVLYDIPNITRSVSMMTFGYMNQNKPNNPEQWAHDCDVLRYHAREVDQAYELLCKCQTLGIINDNLMQNVQNIFNTKMGIDEREDVNEYIKLVR